MEFESTDDAAIIFAQELYGRSPAATRWKPPWLRPLGAICNVGNSTKWGTPVLHSRAPDGRLFT